MIFFKRTIKIALFIASSVAIMSFSSWRDFLSLSEDETSEVENAINRLRLKKGNFLHCGAFINKNHLKPVHITTGRYAQETPIPAYKNDIACLVRDKRKVIIHDDRFFQLDKQIKEDLNLLIKDGVIEKISYYLPEASITNTILFRPEAKKDALILAIVDLKKEVNPYLFGLLLGYDEDDIRFFYQRSNYVDNPQVSHHERLEKLFNEIPYRRWTESDHRIFEQYLKESNINKNIEAEKQKATDLIKKYTDFSIEELQEEFNKLTQ